MKQPVITRIVITGGPCAAKTTFMNYAVEKLEELGYGTLVVSESATELIKAGCVPNISLSLYNFQEIILETQLLREELYNRIALTLNHEHVVILHDRGLMDNRAYLPSELWEKLIANTSHSHVTLRDMRYDAVIHLRTAAFGAEAFYTRDNNTARSETPAQARHLDKRTLAAWIGHSRIHVINNRKDATLQDKLDRAFSTVLKTIGKPITLEIERKFLIAPSFSLENIPVPYQILAIEQAYTEGGYRIRKRSESGVSMYTKTKKIPTSSPLVCAEEETIISKDEYDACVERMLPTTRILTKKRACFVSDEQYFELDIFEKPVHYEGNTLIILERELIDEAYPVILPEWIPVIREVTTEGWTRNRHLATIL